MSDKAQPDPLESLIPEIRRGAIVLAVLSRLKQDEYGYSLKRSLAEAGLDIDEGTLYPLLRRLESQGLLESRWSLEEERPRRYYRLNAAGKQVLRGLAREWTTLAGTIERLLS
jgi:PadR family transcriptional regulator, regulatory protein PadR